MTGAAAGIGLATAHAFAARGDVVMLTDRDAGAAARAAEALGAAHVGIAMDVTDGAAVTRVLDDIVARFGRIDVLVNNAAVIDAHAHALLDIPAATVAFLASADAGYITGADLRCGLPGA